MFIVSAVLAGGNFKIAIELARKKPPTLLTYFRCARLAPGFFALSLPLLAIVVLAHGVGEPENPNTIDLLLMGMFILATLVALFLTYRLSLAWYALADSDLKLRHAVKHSWKRIGSHTRQFFALFVATSVPLAVSWALAMAAPAASTLFDIATAPLITLCWAHAYLSGVQAGI